MDDLINAAQELLDYLDQADVFDTVDDDSDGHTNYSQSHTLRELAEDLEHAIEDAIPIKDAMKTIKEGFITIVQTAIAAPTADEPTA